MAGHQLGGLRVERNAEPALDDPRQQDRLAVTITYNGLA
jgi:hypothetical protein